MWERRGRSQDAVNHQEKKNSTVQLKEEREKKIKQVLQLPNHLYCCWGGWKEGKHPKIRSSNLANSNIHKVNRSTQVIPYFWSQKWKQEAQAPIVRPSTTGTFHWYTKSFENLHIFPSKQHPSLFTNVETEAQRTTSLYPLTTCHSDNTQRGLHFEECLKP